MRAGNEDPVGGQPCGLAHLSFGVVEHFPADVDVVRHHDRDAGFAVVEHEAARMQFVVHTCRRGRRAEVAHQPVSEPRRDVARGRTGQERFLRSWRGRGGGGGEKGDGSNKKAGESVHGMAN